MSNISSEKVMEDVLEAITFSRSEISIYLRDRNKEKLKKFLCRYDCEDLSILYEIAISNGRVEVCEVLNDIMQVRGNQKVL